ncbi:helix-turn-helix domain-containing protein [Streptomyces diastatochromogenes]|nr:helix-turn-helix domain-containing protein [Streptomyces diastatochromogenes]
MASKQPSALPCASGLVHVNARHDTHYVVTGNHLAQHRELTLQAKGLALYLQSLPAGAPVGIKAIAARHRNSELVVARAMRELEACGYLKRVRERLPDGRFVHRTVSYNRPGAEPKPVRETTPAKPPAASKPPTPRTPPTPPTQPTPPAPPAPPTPPASPTSPPAPAPPTPQHLRHPRRRPHPGAARPEGPAAPPAPLSEQHRAAAELLAGLRVHDPGCCCRSGTCAAWPRRSPPGSTGEATRTPSAAPSARTSRRASPTRPASSRTV